jgi:hypothetical protein
MTKLTTMMLSVSACALWLTTGAQAQVAAPLTIGQTFTIESKILGEARRINVYPPAGYDEDSTNARVPVMYMPDGGIGEDFLHIAGLMQIGYLNGTMRPFLLVGIENTQRRRDLTGPTQSAEDRKIAPVVGGSAAFRRFIRDELMPLIDARYRTTRERAIVGESLAGLFVVETLLLEPDLFDSYLAFDPSLWWNDNHLLTVAAARRPAATNKTLYLASSNETQLADGTRMLARILEKRADAALVVYHVPMPEESHGTIYHPAALRAFRQLFPVAESK